MTHLPALLSVLAATSTKKTTNPLVTFLPLILIVAAGYFFFLRPQQKKAAAARAGTASPYEVGDEVQTIGGVIGTILEINGDRYTLLTGSTGDDGNLAGPQPTRIVFIRQAIARKVEPVVDVGGVDDVEVDDEFGTDNEPSIGDEPEDQHGRAPRSFDIGGDEHEHPGDDDDEAKGA